MTPRLLAYQQTAPTTALFLVQTDAGCYRGEVRGVGNVDQFRALLRLEGVADTIIAEAELVDGCPEWTALDWLREHAGIALAAIIGASLWTASRASRKRPKEDEHGDR